ncbi:MAG: hypothetical protein JNL58_27280 [Planctomyces sp.]|nr:hypothetical protein [Planctomyces sp.]
MNHSLTLFCFSWLLCVSTVSGQGTTLAPKSPNRIRLEAQATVDSLLANREFGRYAVIAAEWRVMNDPKFQGLDGTKPVLWGFRRIPRYKVDMDDYTNAIEWSHGTFGQSTSAYRSESLEKTLDGVSLLNKMRPNKYSRAVDLLTSTGKFFAKPIADFMIGDSQEDSLRRLPTLSGDLNSNFLEHVGVKRDSMVAMMEDVLGRRYSGDAGAERADRFVKVLGVDYSGLSDEALKGMRQNLPSPDEVEEKSKQFVQNFQRATDERLNDILEEVKALRRGIEESASLQTQREQLQQDIDALNFANECFGRIAQHLRGDAAKFAQVVHVAVNVGTRIASAYLVTGSMAAIAPPLAIASGLFDLLGLFGGGGPDASQLILEQLAELRREMAEFRAETRLSLVIFRQELLDVGDQVLMRIGAAEANLSRQLNRMEGQLSDVEARVNMIEQRQMANHAQILGRLADLMKVSFSVEYRKMAGRKSDIVEGLARQPNDNAIIREAANHLSTFRSYATDGAASPLVAGGDSRFVGVYTSNSEPVLGEGYAKQLRWISDSPNGAWTSINDFVKLSRGQGIGDAGEATSQINPQVWQVAVNAYLELALASNETGGLVKNDTERRKDLAEMYLAGERLRRVLGQITSNRMGSAPIPEHRLFEKLIDIQLAAIANFEKHLLLQGEQLARELGTNPFSEDLMEPRQSVFRPTQVELDIERLHSGRAPFELPDVKLLTFPDGEKVESAIPKTLRMAKQLGLIDIQLAIDEIGFTEVRRIEVEKEVDGWPDANTRRYARIIRSEQFNGSTGTYYGRTRIGVPQWRGKVFTVLRISVKPLDDRSRFATIVRRRLVCPEEVVINNVDHFSNEKTENSGNPAHADLKDSDDWQSPGRAFHRYNEREGDFLIFGGGRDVPHAVLATEIAGVRKAQIEVHWSTLVSNWLASPMQEADQTFAEENKRGAELLQWVERRCADHICGKVLPFMNRQLLATEQGLGQLGDAVRELHGTQATIQQFAALTMPQQLDTRLMDAIAGENAAFSRTTFAKHLKVPEVTVMPLRISGMVEPGPDGSPTVPLALTMRQNTERLRGALAEAISRQAEMGPPRHVEIDGPLMRLALAAKSLGIDLEAECRQIGGEPNDEWILRNLDEPHRRLAVILGEDQ